MSSIVKVENLKYKTILKNITFSLEENTFNVLIGKNSCGKSTLVKIIYGIIKSEGYIFFDNVLLNDKTVVDIRKNISLITEMNNFEKGTLLENIIIYLKNFEYSNLEARSKAYEVTRKLGISNILSKNINELTSSQLILAKIAKAVSSSPKLLIIDDSLENLDNNYKVKVISYLKKLKTTILLVTNNEEEILFGETILLLNKGKLEQLSINKILEDDKLLVKNNLKYPFMVDLSSKLKSYELLENTLLDMEEMVNKLWN